ncbi:hypothetical protein SFC37_19815 [Bacillus licheniformis]|uniref:hypothetical protein n=1 Tax=Bacillus licheniformis TaxID=1402 RepID=UPI00237CB892|nr:hypothetical protein [Bacillus licheniformis]MCD2487913.1 hypothetical protein [Bacillus licheniformis]
MTQCSGRTTPAPLAAVSLLFVSIDLAGLATNAMVCRHGKKRIKRPATEKEQK